MTTSTRPVQRSGPDSGRPLSRLLRRLDRQAALSAEDREAVSALPITVRYLTPEQSFARAGDSADCCGVILDGYLYRQKGTGAGRRQIIAIQTADDLVGLQTLLLPRFDHDVVALGPAVVGVIPHTAVKAMLRQSQALTECFWRETSVESAIFREWILNLGQRSALARVAHLVCELVARLRAVDLAQDMKLSIPWTQADVADATGISTVHANRVIQELRRIKAIAWREGVVEILDWPLLERIGDFSPDYLNLRDADADHDFRCSPYPRHGG